MYRHYNVSAIAGKELSVNPSIDNALILNVLLKKRGNT